MLIKDKPKIMFPFNIPRHCQYSGAFGPVARGGHTHVLGVAMLDVVLTLLGAYLLRYLTHRFTKYRVPYPVFAIGLFVLSIFLHRMFCVCTVVNGLLFPNDPMCFGVVHSGSDYVGSGGGEL